MGDLCEIRSVQAETGANHACSRTSYALSGVPFWVPRRGSSLGLAVPFFVVTELLCRSGERGFLPA